MIRCDALVVGGGPAGSTCAGALHAAGWHVVLAERARFPRDKVCAGWVTPGVFSMLGLDPAEYRAAGLTLQEITSFRTGLIGGDLIETKYPQVVSYAIRRCEFDHFLIRRSSVHVIEGTTIETLRRQGPRWVINEEIETPVVIGAGGHFCPVARHLRDGADRETPIIAKEAEFRMNGHGTARLTGPQLFFCRDLDGYGWCVPKDEYLNVGLGRRRTHDFNTHFKAYVAFLAQRHALTDAFELGWRGHAYLASGVGPRRLTADGMLLVGDAAGLASPASGEGIAPAIESAHLAARTLIAAGGQFDAGALRPYADVIGRLHPSVAQDGAMLRRARAAVGRMLLRSHTYTRRVVLDRWFLHTNVNAPLASLTGRRRDESAYHDVAED